MSERLRSVGIDVGTTSTQLVISELTIENRASAFAVPDMAITERKILYRSPVYFTPLLTEALVDGDGIREIVRKEYEAADIRREDVDTGAIIITGETSRKENARRVLDALSEFAGDFVVATAGPDLESVLAAKGAGAVERSRETEKPVLHMDIGGGTANLALIRDGEILRTGCLNVGGRLIKYDRNGRITYISHVLEKEISWKVGDPVDEKGLLEIARCLAGVLEAAAGRSDAKIPEVFFTEEVSQRWTPPEEAVMLSFSGGVADCIGQAMDWQIYGDLGVLLGRAIRESSLCTGDYVLGKETIRATVIGAGCHSTQLSGSTVYFQNVQLPMKNLPVMHIHCPEDMEALQYRQDGACVLAWAGIESPSYGQIRTAAKTFAVGGEQPLLLCVEQDMAKALGQALALELPKGAGVLCIDRVHLPEGSYLDIGVPAQGTFPVVIKTLVLK